MNAIKLRIKSFGAALKIIYLTAVHIALAAMVYAFFNNVQIVFPADTVAHQQTLDIFDSVASNDPIPAAPVKHLPKHKGK